MWFDPSINFATRKIQFGKSGSGQTLDTGNSYPVSDENIHICPSKQNNDQISKNNQSNTDHKCRGTSEVYDYVTSRYDFQQH